MSTAIVRARFDAEEDACFFDDTFPPFEGCGRLLRLLGEPEATRGRSAAELARDQDAALLHELWKLARRAIDPSPRGSLVPKDPEKRESKLRELGQAGSRIRNGTWREVYSNTMLALRRYLGADSPDYRHLALDKLKELVGDWNPGPAGEAFEAARRQLLDARDAEQRARGTVPVTVLLPPRRKRPSPGQVAAYQQFRASMDEVCGRILEYILRFYQTHREEFLLVDDESAPRGIDAVAQLRDLVAFTGLFVYPERDGGCDLGFSFACTWDEEHGLGVLVRADGEVVFTDDL
jgi:hypothetical protein